MYELLKNTKNLQSHFVFPTSQDLIEDLEHLVYVQDELFGSTSIYAQYRVMKMVRELGLTVMLDGQGADELFAGYILRYFKVYLSQLLNQKII